ncbi:MAG TPA: hypothetical protein VGM14_16145 [Streptosporangiaceae bacterium]
MAGNLVLAATPAALAAPSVQSPEGIGIAATGLVAVTPTPDATTGNPNPSSVATVSVATILNANVVSAQVSGNTTTAGAASLDTTGIIGALLGGISANAVSSSGTANSKARSRSPRASRTSVSWARPSTGLPVPTRP